MRANKEHLARLRQGMEARNAWRTDIRKLPPMSKPDALETMLIDLRQDLSNALTLINLAIALQRSASPLPALVRTTLQELREHINQALPSLLGEEGEREA